MTLVEPGAASPVTLALPAFAARYTGTVILCMPLARAVEDEAGAPADGTGADSSRPPGAGTGPDGTAGAAPRPFGFRWFVPELLRHHGIWRDVLWASLALQLMALATPLFTQVVIDKVVVHHTRSTLTVVGVALLLFLGFSTLMGWVRQYLVLHTGLRVDAVLGSAVFGHLLRLPVRWFEPRPTGVVVARLQAVETIREFLAGAAVSLLLDLPFLAVFVAVMLWYSVPLTLVALAVIGVLAALSFAVAPLLRQRLNAQFLIGARNQAFTTEYVAGMETVKALQMEPVLERRYGDYLAEYLAASFRTRTLANTYQSGAQALEQLLGVLVLWVGAHHVMTVPGFTIGMLVAFQMFASRLAQPLLRLTGLWQELQQARIAVARLGDVMSAPVEPCTVVPARERRGEGRVEFRGVSFRYGEHLPWLYRDLTLTLEPGRCVALVGPSGAGKSTLAKLLLGFCRPADGQILLDGRDLRHLAANELRQSLGVVPQETVLFSGTVYDNLLLGCPHASFEDVTAACRLAGIHDVIEQLPQGYQAPLGERGVGLSGGQKQRLAIARALLKRPRVLLFDEATASLDPATAEQIARTVNALKGKATVLFIAHRLPKGLAVDAVVQLGGAPGTGREERQVSVVGGEAEP